jgi:hypothetical protein
MDKFIFILIALLPCSLFAAQDIPPVLGKLSTHNQQELEHLFHTLMEEDQFNYTLFGDKPVSLSGDYTVTPYEVTLSGLPSGGIFWRRWALWKEIAKDLHITKYFFIEEPAYNHPGGTMSFVFFINKQAFLEAVNLHIQTFRDVLGQDTTPANLLNKMEQEQAFMKPLKNRELLLGILLGYGEHNAQLYARRMRLRNFISEKTLPILSEKPLPSQGFSSIEEEEKFLQQKLQPSFLQDYGVPWKISPVQFAADIDHNETKLLQKKYTLLRSEISLRYAESNNFLELIISQLVAD